MSNSGKNSWSYTSSKGYSIKEDVFCTWRLYLKGVQVASSDTPYPLLNEALTQNWMTQTEVLELATILQIPEKFIVHK